MIKDSDRGWAWSRALLGEFLCFFTRNKFSFLVTIQFLLYLLGEICLHITAVILLILLMTKVVYVLLN